MFESKYKSDAKMGIFNRIARLFEPALPAISGGQPVDEYDLGLIWAGPQDDHRLGVLDEYDMGLIWGGPQDDHRLGIITADSLAGSPEHQRKLGPRR